MRYSVARQSVTEQQEMLVPGTSRLRNHGPSAGSASAGGCAPAVVDNRRAAVRKRRVMTRTDANPMPTRRPGGRPRDPKTRTCTVSVYHRLAAKNSLHGQPRVDRAAVERCELRGEGRDGDLGQRLRRPTTLAVDHAQRPHM